MTDARRVTSSYARRNLVVACGAHALHDGYTDLLYVLLPIWKTEYALSYAALAGLRALYYGTMAAAQVPGTRWLHGLGAPLLLTAGTALAACGYVIAGTSGGFAGLCVGLAIGGLGSSTQHPNASALVSQAYGDAARAPLGLYNFAGDIGKSIFPAATALMLTVIAWRSVTLIMAGIGLAVAVAIHAALPRSALQPDHAKGDARGRGRRGFKLLLAVGVLDTATRMGFLLFLPFLVTAKGGSDTTIGLALALVFIGGAFGKAVCGWLGERAGLLATVITTEAATAALVLATLASPLPLVLWLLPVLGVMLNGTSSVLYGTVPDFAQPGQTAKSFALFYTGVIGSGALAPIGYGLLADHAGRSVGVIVAGLTALATIPLATMLFRVQRRQQQSVATRSHGSSSESQ